MDNEEKYERMFEFLQEKYENDELPLEYLEYLNEMVYDFFIERDKDEFDDFEQIAKTTGKVLSNTSKAGKKIGDIVSKKWKNIYGKGLRAVAKSPNKVDDAVVHGVLKTVSPKAVVKRSEKFSKFVTKPVVNNALKKREAKWKEAHPGQEYTDAQRQKDREKITNIVASKAVGAPIAAQAGIIGALTPPGVGGAVMAGAYSGSNDSNIMKLHKRDIKKASATGGKTLHKLYNKFKKDVRNSRKSFDNADDRHLQVDMS